MSQKRTITFAAAAFDDLEAIRAWYENQLVFDVGNRFLQEIISRVERLATLPESGRIVPEFSLANLREIIHPPFRIVYRLDRNKIRVVRIWRSERILQMPK